MTHPPKTRRQRRFGKLIDRELQGRLPASLRPEVREHLRANRDARDHYDRGIEAFRALADDDIAAVELEQVEQWLFDGPDAIAGGPGEPVPTRRFRLWTLWTAVAACAALLLFVDTPSESTQSDEFTARGHDTKPGLALDVLCSKKAALTPDLRPAGQHGCDGDGTMGFAYRVTTDTLHGNTLIYLSLFGVDQYGAIQYYTPTPVDADAIAARRGDNQATALGIDLAINHRPGQLRVFGLLSPNVPTVPNIDRLAEAVMPHPLATAGDLPWHRRIDAAALGEVCPTLDACESAEVSLTIREQQP